MRHMTGGEVSCSATGVTAGPATTEARMLCSSIDRSERCRVCVRRGGSGEIKWRASSSWRISAIARLGVALFNGVVGVEEPE